MRRAAGIALFVLLAGGCERARDVRLGDLRISTTETAVVRTSAPIRVEGAPARNVADVQFLTPRIGFLTASTGQFDHEPARIQRTVDGGRTWHDVWRRPRTRLEWIAFADRRHGYVGAGSFILRTVDGGRSWTRRPMSLPRALHRRTVFPPLLAPTFVTPRLGFAVTDPSSFAGSVFLRTIDGGAHWHEVSALRGAAQVDFVSAQTGFATANDDRRCVGGLYRTDDAGSTWNRVPLPCVPYPLLAVDFLDAEHGFVAGGQAAQTEEKPSQVVFATADGGGSWQRRYVNPNPGFTPGGGNPIASLHLVDSQRGWATTGRCKCCPSNPCAGEVMVTADGGWTWRWRGQEVQFAQVGARFAWVVPMCDDDCDLIWRTTDAGRRWRPVARPDLLSLATVEATGQFVAVTTWEGARFVSPDGGRLWTLDAAGVDPQAPATRRPGLTVELGLDRSVRVNGRSVTLSNPDVVSLAFTSPGQGVVAIRRTYFPSCRRELPEAGQTLLRTNDGGRSWRRLRIPVAIGAISERAGVIAALGVRACAPLLLTSIDGGRSWRVRRLPGTCLPSVGAARALWLACRSSVLRSEDGGRSWKRYQRVPLGLVSLAAVSPAEAWAVAGSEESRDGKSRLWHTSDGGRTWRQVWPSFPTRG